MMWSNIAMFVWTVKLWNDVPNIAMFVWTVKLWNDVSNIAVFVWTVKLWNDVVKHCNVCLDCETVE